MQLVKDIEDKEYEVLSRHTNGKIHWYCTVCNDSSVEMQRYVHPGALRMNLKSLRLEGAGM